MNNNQKGFTLVEVIVSLFLMNVLIMGFYRLQDFFAKQQEQTVNGFLTLENANSNLEMISREIRNSRYGENGAYPLEILKDQEIAFYSDIDGDDEAERVRYFLQGKKLYKGVTQPTSFPKQYILNTETITEVSDIIQNDTQAIFYYYNKDWPKDVTNNPLLLTKRQAETRMVGINIFTNSDIGNINNNYNLDTKTNIRTLKDNL